MDENTAAIRLAGLGGQGVVLAGLLLGHAAVCDGLYAAGSSSYGAQSRGSLCAADIVVSRGPIDYPRIERASLLIAMSQEGYDAYGASLVSEGRILFDPAFVVPGTGKRDEIPFNLTAASRDRLKDTQVVNVAWTGVIASLTGLISKQGLEKAIRTHIPDRYADLNLRALHLGIELGTMSLPAAGLQARRRTSGTQEYP